MATKVINTILNMRDNMSKGLLATAKNMEKVDKGSVSATRSVLRFTNKAGKAVTDFAAKTVKRGAVALAGLATGFPGAGQRDGGVPGRPGQAEHGL